MEKKIGLIAFNELPSSRDASEFMFDFIVVNTDLIGAPEEESETLLFKIHVIITGRVEAAWLYKNPTLDIMKVCYEYAKRHLIQKLNDKTIKPLEQLWLASNSVPNKSPYDTNRIKMEVGTQTITEVSEDKLMENTNLLQLGASIIDFRDFINSIVYGRHKEKLFMLKEERDVIYFFRDANSIEEFTYSINTLQNLVVNLNEQLLRILTGIVDTEKKSITLLESYLKTFKNYDDFPIKVFRNINGLRKSHPTHGDNFKGVQQAYNFFNLAYPITNFADTWRTILSSYLDALQRMTNIIKTKEED